MADDSIHYRCLLAVQTRIQGLLLEGIAAEVNRKYGAALTADLAASGDAWFFALEPRPKS